MGGACCTFLRSAQHKFRRILNTLQPIDTHHQTIDEMLLLMYHMEQQLVLLLNIDY